MNEAKEKDRALYAVYGDAIIDYCRDHDTPLMTVFDERNGAILYQYGNGIWREIESLDPIIALAAEGQNDLTQRLVREINHFIRICPRIAERDVRFDQHGMIACSNGLLDPGTMELRDYRPEDYARRKGTVAFVPGALSPIFDEFIAGCFEDKNETVSKALIDLIQEFYGASLAVHLLPRECRKAMIVVGGANTGKTQIAGILRGILGEGTASPHVSTLADRFGLETLFEAAGWISDDAINEGDSLDPQKFKVIVTGERVDIIRKGQSTVRGHRFNIPVMLTTNALAKAKDSTDAVISRSLIVRCDCARTPEWAVKWRRARGLPFGGDLSDHILKAEASGILNWALAGLLRLMERGHYHLAEEVLAELERFKNDNNPVGEWAAQAIVVDKKYRVARADLLCSFHGYQRENDGGNARAWGGRYVFPRLRTVYPAVTDSKSDGVRFVEGIKLTETGKAWFKQHNLNPLAGGSEGVTAPEIDPNKTLSPF